MVIGEVPYRSCGGRRIDLDHGPTKSVLAVANILDLINLKGLVDGVAVSIPVERKKERQRPDPFLKEIWPLGACQRLRDSRAERPPAASFADLTNVKAVLGRSG